MHINFNNKHQRRAVNKAMEKEVKRLGDEDIWQMSLRQVWDENNRNIFLKQENRFTSEGLNIFWLAVDRTILYCDKKISKVDSTISDKFLDQPSKPKTKPRTTYQHGPDNYNNYRGNNYAAQNSSGYYNRYYWQRN